jgi:hypothetical protein
MGISIDIKNSNLLGSLEQTKTFLFSSLYTWLPYNSRTQDVVVHGLG